MQQVVVKRQNYRLVEGRHVWYARRGVVFQNIRQLENVDFKTLFNLLDKYTPHQCWVINLDNAITMEYSMLPKPTIRIRECVVDKRNFDLTPMGNYYLSTDNYLMYYILTDVDTVFRRIRKSIVSINSKTNDIKIDFYMRETHLWFHKTHVKHINLDSLSHILSQSSKPVDDVWHYFRFIDKAKFNQFKNRFIKEDLSNFTDHTCFKPVIYRDDDGDITVDPLPNMRKAYTHWYDACPWEWTKIDYIRYLHKYNNKYKSGKNLRALGYMNANEIRTLFVHEYKEKLIHHVTCLSKSDKTVCTNPLEMITQEEIANLDVGTLAFVLNNGKFWCIDRSMFNWDHISDLPVMKEWIQNPLASPMDVNGYGGKPNPRAPDLVRLGGMDNGLTRTIVRSSIPKTLRKKCPIFKLVHVDRYRIGNANGRMAIGAIHGQYEEDIWRLENMTLAELKLVPSISE